MTVINKREYNFDYLRVFSAFFVVLSHVKAMEWKTVDVNSLQWAIINAYGMMARFSIAIFFMVSGRFSLDLGKKFSINKAKTKIITTLKPFIFWTTIYTCVNIFRVEMFADGLKQNLTWIIIEFFTGEYHMWFLFAICGLYLITPLLRLIIQDKKMTEYFLVLFVVFGVFWPLIERLPAIGIFFRNAQDLMELTFPIGYVGYYILGYYLYKYPVSKKVENMLYFSGALGLILTIIISTVVSRTTGIANEEFCGFLAPHVAATGIAVYVFGINRLRNIQYNRLVSFIGKYSLGCYLAHPLVLWIFEWIGFVPTKFPVIISVPGIALIAMTLALLLSFLLSKIPFFKGVV